MNILNNSTNVHAVGNTVQYIHYHTGESGLDKLQRVAVSSATYTSSSGEKFARPRCHENTRVAVIDSLLEWVLGIAHADASFMWLYGDVGAGKSTIAQTFAEMWAQQRRLLGSFFFSRTDTRRCSYRSLAATIAYHAATVVPSLRNRIIAVVETDPSIFEQPLEIQLKSLLLDPIDSLSEEERLRIPNLIVIDGLDECVDREEQGYILEVLSGVVQQSSVPLKIFVASRPGMEIKHKFDDVPLLHLSTRLALDHSFKPEDDIMWILGLSFEDIKGKHYLKARIPSAWPGAQNLNQLVLNSSGQFIYADIVVRYVSSLRHNPVERLNIILGLQPCPSNERLPFAYMDTLYTHLFSEFTPEDLKDVLRIFGLLIFGMETSLAAVVPTISHAADFLCLKIERVDLLVGGLESVLRVEPFEDICQCRCPDNAIHVRHASLAEFLLDERRSKEFHINQQQYATDVLLTCLKRFEVGLNENDHDAVQTFRHFSQRFACGSGVKLTEELRQSLFKFSLWSAPNRRLFIKPLVDCALALMVQSMEHRDVKLFAHFLHIVEKLFWECLGDIERNQDAFICVCNIMRYDSMITKFCRLEITQDVYVKVSLMCLRFLCRQTAWFRHQPKIMLMLCTMLREKTPSSPELISFLQSRELQSEASQAYGWFIHHLIVLEDVKSYEGKLACYLAYCFKQTFNASAAYIMRVAGTKLESPEIDIEGLLDESKFAILHARTMEEIMEAMRASGGEDRGSDCVICGGGF